MGCCSSKRKSQLADDSCYVCENIEPYDRNIYTRNLLKCYPKYPAMNEFANMPYYNQSSDKNLNFNNSCKCCRVETGYERLDSIKYDENYIRSSTDDETEEIKHPVIMPKPPKQPCSSKRFRTKGTREELSAISYECKSSDSYISFTCKCLRSKTPRYYNNKNNNCKDLDKQKNVGIQKESEKCCTVREQYEDYIKKMEKSWYCCYNLLHEIKELLAGIDECDNSELTKHSPISYGKVNALPCLIIPENNGIFKNDIEENKCEDDCRPTSI